MLPKNVSAVKDRHGQTRYRFRKAGFLSRYLPGEPGSPEFQQAYKECFDPTKPPARVYRKKRSRRPPLSAFRGVSVVYFLATKSGAIKIGTTTDLPERIKKLQTGSPETIRLVSVTPGGPEVEAEYHGRFADFKIRGEWFRGREVRAEAERLKRLNFCPTTTRENLSNPENREKTVGF